MPHRLASVLLSLPLLCANVVAADFDRFQAWCDRPAAERELLRDASDGKLDQCTVLQASLRCAHHSPASMDRCERIFSDAVQQCRTAMGQSESRPEVEIFRVLHTNFLYGKYNPDLYDVGKTLQNGEFNCLTATILYQALCREFSLTVTALWEPSHVRCWLSQGEDTGRPIETTASTVRNAVGGTCDMVDLDDRLLTDTELLGKILYNKGVQALTKEEYASALAATWASYELDALDYPAFSNLRACLNNWALQAHEAGDRQLAADLLDEGLRLDPDYDPFRRNRALLSE